MEKITDILYLPTLRCNLNCKHCGENQDVKKDEEVDCLYILQKLQESILIDTKMIVISGGEPFLNDTFPKFLIKGIRETDFQFSITSNGYFFEKIKDTIDVLEEKERERLSFNISIDGLENTHNRIRRNELSFGNAVRTVRYLTENNICVNINTVVQQENINELQQIQSYFKNIDSRIKLFFIPFAADISENNDCIYTEQYQKELWKHTDTKLNKKIILSKGRYQVLNCHAGERNVVIGSDGKVYTCLTGGVL